MDALYIQMEDISKIEVTDAIRNLKNNMVAGEEAITIGMLKENGEENIVILVNLFKDMLAPG